MKDKELKKKLIESGCFEDYRKQRFNYFENGEYNKIDSQLYFHRDSGEQMTPQEIKANFQMKQARKEQVKKIRKHFTYWLNNDFNIYFLTFSYSDDKRRKEMTSKTLKQYCIKAMAYFDDYIINIDYGKENERMHFHALGAIKRDKVQEFEEVTRETKKGYRKGKKLITKELKEYERKVGWFDCEPCEDNEESAKRLSRYIDKLTLHSVKVKQTYCSVKKGTEYQEYREKDIEDIIKKDFKRRTREENEIIKKRYGNIEDEINSYKKIIGYFGLKESQVKHGTKSEIKWLIKEREKEKIRNQEHKKLDFS